MAIVGTGKWVAPNFTTSVQDRDYFSGPITALANTSYDDAHTYEFGFSASEVHIVNHDAATHVVFQWITRKGQAVDSGMITEKNSYISRSANKTGVRLRVDSGSASLVYVIAIG